MNNSRYEKVEYNGGGTDYKPLFDPIVFIAKNLPCVIHYDNRDFELLIFPVNRYDFRLCYRLISDSEWYNSILKKKCDYLYIYTGIKCTKEMKFALLTCKSWLEKNNIIQSEPDVYGKR